MTKRKNPAPKQPVPEQPTVAPGEDTSDTLDKAPHAAPDGERIPPEPGRGSDANVDSPGRRTSPGVESESDEDDRSRRRDLGP
jgi:hypothetical protein